MASTTTGDTGMSAVLMAYYEKMALDYLFPQMYLYQFADKKPLPKNMGKSITFHRFAAPTAKTVLTEGVAPSAAVVSSVTVSASIEQLGGVRGITDLVEMTAIESIVEAATRILADEAALSIDTYIRNSIIDGSGVFVELVSASPSTYGAVSAIYSAQRLTEGVVRKAALRLQRLNVRPFKDGFYVWVTHPTAAETLRSDTNWINYHQYTEQGIQAVYNGESGRLHQFRFVVAGTTGSANDGAVYIGSAAGAITSATSCSAVYNMAFGQGYFGVTEIDGGFKMFIKTANPYDKSDPLNQYSTVGWKWTGTSKVLNVSAGVIVPTAVNFV